MTLEILQKEMIKAMKERDKFRKDVISSLVSAVKKAGIDEKCRDNIPESIVDKALLKEQKTMQEMIDTCPLTRPDTLMTYQQKKKIIDEFAPKLISDEDTIKKMILEIDPEVLPKNRGLIMKSLKGKVDMKVANKMVAYLMELH